MARASTPFAIAGSIDTVADRATPSAIAGHISTISAMIIDATEYDDSDDEEQALLDELAEWSRLEDAKAAPRGRPADDAAKIRTKLRVLRAALRACTSPRRRVALRERIHAERAWLDRLSAGVDASARRGHAREPSNGSDWSFFSHGTTGEGGSFHAPSPPRLFRFSADHARLDGAGALEALAKDLAAVARDARPAGRSLEGELDAAATGAAARRTGGPRSLSLELEAAADGVPDWYPPSAPESPPKHLASHPRVVDDLASAAFGLDLEAPAPSPLDLEAPVPVEAEAPAPAPRAATQAAEAPAPAVEAPAPPAPRAAAEAAEAPAPAPRAATEAPRAAAAAPAPPSATSPLDLEAPSPHRRRIIAPAEAPRSALADRTNLGLRGSKALVAGVAAPGAKLVPRRSPIPIKTRRRSGTY